SRIQTQAIVGQTHLQSRRSQRPHRLTKLMAGSMQFRHLGQYRVGASNRVTLPETHLFSYCDELGTTESQSKYYLCVCKALYRAIQIWEIQRANHPSCGTSSMPTV